MLLLMHLMLFFNTNLEKFKYYCKYIILMVILCLAIDMKVI